METRQSSIRVLMLPWLAHGHISPFIELAKKLTERNFYIYFCSTPINLSSIKKRLPAKYSLVIQLVELHLPSMPELPPHYHTTNGLPTRLMPILKNAFEMASPTFSNILQTLKPDLVIYDYNQPWAPAIASSLNIPAVQFQPTGAVMVSFALHMLQKRIEKYPFPAVFLRSFESIKNRQSTESSVNDVKEKDSFLEALKRSCNIILIKTFTEIEGKYIEYLSNLSGKKMVTVSPLVQEPVNEDEHTEISQWLDKKDESSIVFVSFGSECFLTMEEVAHGLELSKVNFIWVVRFPVGEKTRVEEALPEGFLERVRDRGMVVEGWAPQAKILQHSSTGGFVSHCGWSSIMESMKYGVPIIAMPMHIDQPLNSRLVEEVGVAVEVMRDDNGTLRREEIAQVIRKVVMEENGKDVRIKARELSEKIRMKGDEEIDGVVEELVQVCKERKM